MHQYWSGTPVFEISLVLMPQESPLSCCMFVHLMLHCNPGVDSMKMPQTLINLHAVSHLIGGSGSKITSPFSVPDDHSDYSDSLLIVCLCLLGSQVRAVTTLIPPFFLMVFLFWKSFEGQNFFFQNTIFFFFFHGTK